MRCFFVLRSPAFGFCSLPLSLAGTILLAECWFVILIGVGVDVIFGVWKSKIWG